MKKPTSQSKEVGEGILVVDEQSPGPGEILSNFQFSEHTLRFRDKHIKIRISRSHLNILRIKWNLCAHQN